MTTADAVRATRAGEWSALSEAVDRAWDLGVAVIVVDGDAGIGKSWFLRHAAAHLEREGWLTLVADGDWFEQLVPYAALRRAVERASWPELDDSRRPLHDALDGSSSVGELRALTAQLLRAARARHPVAIVLDDVQLVDADTLALLAGAVASGGRAPLIIACGARTGSLKGLAHFGALLSSIDSQALTELTLGPLDRSGLEAMVTAVRGRAVDGGTLALVERLSGGNPFLVEQALLGLRTDDETSVDLGSMQRTSLIERILWMGADAATLARTCAVVRRLLLDRLPLLADLSGLPTLAAGRAFDALIAHGVLIEAGEGYHFAHTLLREALLADVGPIERRTIARRVGEWIAQQAKPLDAADVVERAMCAAETAERGDDAAVTALTAAAELSAAAAPHAAIEWYLTARGLLADDSPEAATICARMARVHLIAGEPAAAAREGERSLSRLPLGGLRTRTVSHVALALVATGDIERAVCLLDAELQHDDNVRLRGHRAHLMARLGRGAESRIDEARALDALRLASPIEASMALLHLTHARVVHGRWRELDELWARQSALLPMLTEESQLSVYLNRAIHLVVLGDERDRATLDAARTLSARLAPNLCLPELVVAESWHDLYAGSWQQLLSRAVEARVALESSNELIASSTIRALEIEVLASRGEWALARRLAASDVTHPFAVHHNAWAVAGLELSSGHAEQAITVVERALADRPAPSSVLGFLLCRRLEAEQALDRVRKARATLAELAEVTVPFGRLGEFEILLAQSGFSRDPRLAHEALLLVADREWPFLEARAHLRLGELGGDDDVDHLLRAHEGFNDLGAVPWRRRAANALRARGQPVPRTRRRTASGFTDTERQIAALIRDGQRNRDIARALCVSLKTVERYLTRMYAKAGVSSRLELALRLEKDEASAPATSAS